MTDADGMPVAGGEAEILQWRTYSQRAYSELRSRILDGRLAPGTKIIVRVLAEDLGLSPTPIKNALAALEREGFLETVAYRGYSVPQTDPDLVGHALEVLSALDVLATQRIVVSPDRDGIIEELREVIDRQRRAGVEDDTTSRSGFDLNFHKVMWERSGNRQLMTAAEHQRGLVLVASGGLLELPERRPEVRAEHEEIVEALAAGDTGTAAQACRRHMTLSAQSVIARLTGKDQSR